MPISVSGRDDDDDDDDDDIVGQECDIETYEKCNMPTEELVATEADGTEKLGGQDCVSCWSVDGHFHENFDKSCVPVIRDSGSPPDSGGGISAMDVDNSISDTGSHLIVNEGKDIEFDSRIVCGQACSDMKGAEVDGIVSDSLTGHKEVVSVRVSKLHIDGEKFAFDGESVKMDTNSSSNET
jgi:hypothetical protein